MREVVEKTPHKTSTELKSDLEEHGVMASILHCTLNHKDVCDTMVIVKEAQILEKSISFLPTLAMRKILALEPECNIQHLIS